MGMDMRVYVGPMVKCVGLRPGRNVSDISYEEFGERLTELTSHWKTDFDTWAPNVSTRAKNARFDKWEETHLLELSREDIATALRIFRKEFGIEIEALNGHYDEARVCFGAMSYYS